MTAGQQDGRNWAVALVHGIGHTEPIAMLRLVTGAIQHARKDLRLDPHVEVHAPKPWPRDAAYEPISQHVQHGTVGGSEVRFATAFWSDVARVGESFVNVIGSLALGGLGVRFFADVAAGGRSVVARLLHFLLTFMILLLSLGFLPVVMCSLLVSVMALLAYYFFSGETNFGLQAPFIAIGTLLVTVVVYRLGVTRLWDIREDRRLAIPIFRVFLGLGVAMAALFLLDHPRGLGDGRTVFNGTIAAGLQWALDLYAGLSGNLHFGERLKLLDETSRYIAFLQLLQYLCGFGVIFSTAIVLVLLVLNMLVPGQDKGQRRSYLLAAVSVITMWSLMLLVLWPENLLTSWAINTYYGSSQENWKPANISYGFNVLEWRFFPMTIDGLEDIRKLIPLLWFELYFFVFLIAAALAAGTLILWRLAWCGLNHSKAPAFLDRFRPPTGSAPKRRHRPRLILSPLYQGAVVAFMLSISVTVFAHLFRKDKWVAENILGLKIAGDSVPHEIVLNTPNVALGVGAGLVVFVLLAHTIKQAVKLALDVVNHFATPTKGFPIRRRIASRFKDTLEFLLADCDKPHLVVICHSQGTVITFDTLFGHRDRNGDWHDGLWAHGLDKRVASLTILTFGSPLTNLYQNYFTRLYPPFSQHPNLMELQSDRRVQWFNSYRIDDFVGTYIDPALDRFPVNVPMPVGGHTRYWEQAVFQRLFAEPGMEKVFIDLTAVADAVAPTTAHSAPAAPVELVPAE